MVNPYNLSSQELLARTLMAEAANQPYQGQLAAASVLANRVASPNYPNTYTGAILQPGQISAFNGVTGYAGGEGANNLWQGQISPQVNEIAARVVAGEYEDPTGGALNYYNPAIANPSWGGNAGEGWVDIGDHRFGTADGGGASRISGSSGTSGMVGSSGNDRLVDVGSEAPDTLGGRIKQFFGRPNQDPNNPTVAAKRYDAAAERAFNRADSSMDVFNSNAPVSWTNVFGTLGNRAMGSINEKRATEQEAEATARVQELMASGNLDPETIAAVSALDPEMGRALQGQAWSVDNREDEQQFRREERIASEAAAEAAANRADARTREFEKFKTTLPTDETRQVDEYLERTGVSKDDPDYGEKWANTHASMFGTQGKDNRSTLEKNVEAAGYVPGTQAFQDRMDYLLDPKNAAEVEAAKQARKIDTEWQTETGKKAATRYDGMMTTAGRAPKMLASLERMEKALGNMRTGIGAGAATSVGQVMSYLGISVEDMPAEIQGLMEQLNINPESAASAEIIEALGNEMVTGMIGTDGFPANNFSDADRDFLKAIFPGITDTEIGAYEKLATLKYNYTMAAMKQEEWFNWREENGDSKNSYERFEAEWNKEMIANAEEDMQEVVYQMTEAADAEQGIVHIPWDSTTEDVMAMPAGSRVRDPSSNKVIIVPPNPLNTSEGQ